MHTELPTYVLVTPARNEAAFIEKTILSVTGQTALPLRWVVVSDGSTDATAEIVARYASKYRFLELVELPRRRERDFAGKIRAFNAGLARVGSLAYDAIGCLDGDVSFDSDYFAFLLTKLAEDRALGLVGTPYRDPLNQTYDYRFACIEHVTGPCQLFRRQCFEDIGGYLPVKGGAVDRIADISARMAGWKTRTYTEKLYLHHRHTGTAQRGLLLAKFRDGLKDYSVGSSPVWEAFRAIYQMRKRPFVFGGLMLLAGYVSGALRRIERPVSRQFVDFTRQEQMHRLKALFVSRMRYGSC